MRKFAVFFVASVVAFSAKAAPAPVHATFVQVSRVSEVLRSSTFDVLVASTSWRVAPKSPVVQGDCLQVKGTAVGEVMFDGSVVWRRSPQSFEVVPSEECG